MVLIANGQSTPFHRAPKVSGGANPAKNRLGGPWLLKCELFYTESRFGILARNTIKRFTRVGSNYNQVKQFSSVTKFMFHAVL